MASQVTTQARKTVSFKSPYIGATFQRLAQEVFGRDGYLSGGLTTDNGLTITVEPFKMVSRGIIGETLANSVVDVPTSPEPWYIVASLPDDDPESGVVVQVTRSLALAATGVVIASKSGDVWRNPVPVNVQGATQKAGEAGPESGFGGNYDNTGGLYASQDGTTVVEKIFSNIGRIVTPEGFRLVTDSLNGESAKQLDITPLPASTSGRRRDQIVLRQREGFSSEIAYLQGGTQEGGYAQATIGTATSGIRPDYYAKHGGTDSDQWWAWANGNDLHIFGGRGGAAFGDTVLLTGAGAISSPRFVGQRASDNALILLYLDGGDLQVVSFNPTTGAKIDTETNLDGLGNAVNRVAGVIDQDGLMRLVFEYDDGTSPSQQIYYGKFSIATATWGAAATSPQYLAGSNSGFNDTKPQIKVCRNGISHVVFIRGTGTNEFGDLVYTRLHTDGSLLGSATHAASTAVGEGDLNEVDYSDGVSQFAYHSFTTLSLTITPHDEIYASIGAGRSTQTPSHLLLFSPELELRTGFAIIRVAAEGLQNGSPIVSGDAGEIVIAHITAVASIIAGRTRHLGIQPGADGLVDMVTGSDNFGATGAALTDDFTMGFSPTGEIVYSWLSGTNVQHLTSYGARKVFEQNPPELHPSDLLLAVVNVDLHASGTVEEQGIEVYSARKKRNNYPVLVGKQGDYLGYGSLQAAVKAISADGGGEIVLRSGHHYPGEFGITIPSNVSITGENGAVIDGDVIMGGDDYNTNLTFGNVLEDNVDLDFGKQVPGFWAKLQTSGWHRVVKVLRPRESDGGFRVLLSNGLDGAAPDASGPGFVELVAGGQRLENVTINGNLDIQYARHCTLRNISLVGTSATFGVLKCYECLFENFDLTQASTTTAVSVSSGEYNTYKDFHLADDRGVFTVADTEQHPTLVGCKGDDANAASNVYNLTGTRTTPVYAVDCEGRFAATNIEFVTTEVGKLVRVPEGLGAMKLEDDNTRAASGPIELTGAAAAFDGATPQVLVDSVNERLLAAGDTMTGDLTMAADIPTDGTTRTIGSLAGAATARFNAGLNTVNILGIATFQSTSTFQANATFEADILPNTTGNNLGSGGARWDAFLEELDVTTVLSNLIPNASGQDLGSGAARWDGFLAAMDISGQVTGNIVPVAAGQDLGAGGNEWDVFANDITQVGSFYHPTKSRMHPVNVGGDIGDAGGSWARSADGLVGTTVGGNYWFPVIMEIGERILSVVIAHHYDGGANTVSAELFKNDGGGIVSSLGSATSATPGGGPVPSSFTITLGTPEVVGAGESFFLELVSDDGDPDLKFFGFRVNYDRIP